MNLGGVLLLALAIKFFFFSKIKKKTKYGKKMTIKGSSGFGIREKNRDRHRKS